MKHTKLMLVALLTGVMGQVEAKGFGKSFAGGLTGSFVGTSLANATSNRASYSDDLYHENKRLKRRIRELERENDRLSR